MKNNKHLRLKYHTDYADLSEFSAKARLLQSIWREEKGFDFENYGNFLKVNFAKNSDKNFLTKTIFEIVKFEVENAKKHGKVISEPRIWSNLLSSQPLAFNLFGELKQNNLLATKIFKDIYLSHDIEYITKIEFEYSPGRRDLKYTGDSSAFDVFIEYKTSSGQLSFFGIEVKYAEHLKDKPSTHKIRYEEISNDSKFFDMSQLENLKAKPIQQIWRDHLLTLSMFISNKDYYRGDFIYLYPSGNKECVKAITKYKETFLPDKESYFNPLIIEKFVEVLKKYSSEKWILDFEDRYMNFNKIKQLTGEKP